MKTKDTSIVTWIMSLVAIIFGLITIKSGGTTLFVEETRVAAGDVVLFVLWINFILGFAYIAAGIGLLMGKTWAKNLSLAIAGITLITYAAFGFSIALGSVYKIKTVKVMAVRSLIWVAIAYQTVVASKSDNQN